MNMFKISNLNVITERRIESEPKQFFIQAHCEVVEASNPKGGEAFIINVVSPGYLTVQIGDSFVLGRGMILTNDFDVEKIKEKIQTLVNGSKAQSWAELSSFIERYFDWV